MSHVSLYGCRFYVLGHYVVVDGGGIVVPQHVLRRVQVTNVESLLQLVSTIPPFLHLVAVNQGVQFRVDLVLERLEHVMPGEVLLRLHQFTGDVTVVQVVQGVVEPVKLEVR